jgi:hypothetical protein
VDALRPVVRLRDERGVEAFYSLAVSPYVRLKLNVQKISPTTASGKNVTFRKMSTNISF